jgi:hypothetical protein
MAVPNRIFWWGVVLLFAAPYAFLAQGNSRQDIEDSCQHFVKNFYDWYVPKANMTHTGPASDLALKYRRHTFSSELYTALEEDSEARAKVAGKGEIVGIDFDPFLFSQDPCERYVVGNVTRKGNRYWVEVFGLCSGKKSATPDVVPELMTKDGQWFFVDFHRGNRQSLGDGSLLTALREAREYREKHPE